MFMYLNRINHSKFPCNIRGQHACKTFSDCWIFRRSLFFRKISSKAAQSKQAEFGETIGYFLLTENKMNHSYSNITGVQEKKGSPFP